MFLIVNLKFLESNAGKKSRTTYIYICLCKHCSTGTKTNLCSGNLSQLFEIFVGLLWDFCGVWFWSTHLFDFYWTLMEFCWFLWIFYGGFSVGLIGSVPGWPICGIFLVFFGNFGIVMVFAFGLPKMTDQIVELPWLQSK